MAGFAKLRPMQRARLAQAFVVAVMALASLAGDAVQSRAHAQGRAATSTPAAAYDLAADEAIGGHTLERHVGRTDAELAERLRREPRISAASTFADAATAASVVALALEANRARVEAWAARKGPRPNLVIGYVSRAGPIGRSLRRGQRMADACRRARIVLRWHERRDRWFVLTSYPEADR